MATLSKTEIEAKKVELLLLLWDMSEGQELISKSKLTDRIKRKHEKSADFEPIYLDLAQKNAIEVNKESRYEKIKLTEKGENWLDQGLSSKSFCFYSKGKRSVVGAKVADALLKWIRKQEEKVDLASPEMNKQLETNSNILSYEVFKPVALNIYEQLNRDYSYDDLVPIYRIRREIGDRVTRHQFDEWISEMQATDIFQLIGGEMPELTPEKAEDSIKTSLGGIRYYAKRL